MPTYFLCKVNLIYPTLYDIMWYPIYFFYTDNSKGLESTEFLTIKIA